MRPGPRRWPAVRSRGSRYSTAPSSRARPMAPSAGAPRPRSREAPPRDGGAHSVAWCLTASGASMSTSRIIILGTGTGVGKTWVASSITRALRRSGVTAVALKPIETGVEAGAEGSDATLLRRESSIAPAAPPFVFPDPVSPHLAARRRDRTIELRAVSNYVDQHEARI